MWLQRQTWTLSQRARALLFVFLIALFTFRRAPAQTGEIKALIVGNDLYQRSNMFPSLRGTPSRDAEAVEAALRSAGVPKKNIVTLHNLTYNGFYEAIHNFRQSLSSEDSAIFYYSGHGFSIDDHAFLVPIDFVPSVSKRSAQLRSISFDKLKKDLSKAQMRALIIDACRTNIPLLKQVLGPRSSASLANLYDGRPAGTGELVVFATQGGKPAIADAPEEGLSFFTYFLVKRLRSAPSDVGTLAHFAQIDTARQSHHSQEPDVRDNLQGFMRFDIHEPSAPLQVAAPARTSEPLLPTKSEAALPIICPKGASWSDGWIVAFSSYQDSVLSFGPLPNYEEINGQVNPLVVNEMHNRIGFTAVDPGTQEKLFVLFREALTTLNRPEPLRGPNGPINLVTKIKGATYRSRQDPRHLQIDYSSVAGTLEVGNPSFKIEELSEFTKETQAFILSLELLAQKKLDQACEASIQRIVGALNGH